MPQAPLNLTNYRHCEFHRPPPGESERTYGTFSRTIELPFRIDPDKVQARFSHGVIEIELQRPETDKPKRITINAH
jgi:hypothetical protein